MFYLKKNGIIDICKIYNINIQYVGRHTYFTNIDIDLQCEQIKENVQKGSYYSMNPFNYRQGGTNVHNVIEKWLKYINKGENI